MLLAGVNDDLETNEKARAQAAHVPCASLLHLSMRLINGSAHLRTSVAKGIEIIEGLRGHTTGYAGAAIRHRRAGGGGKVPINQVTFCIMTMRKS